MTIFINGRFLTQKTSGVQRFAREIVRALDDLVCQDENEWVLVLPDGAPAELKLDAIRTHSIGGKPGHLWEQTSLYAATRGGKLVNLCNSGPVMHGRSLTVIHDAMIFRTPENFSKAYRTVHTMLGHILARRGRIATVSEFSKSELREVIGAENVTVIPNSCEHMATLAQDRSVLVRLGLEEGNYLLFVGSPTPNKNIGRAIEAIRLMAPKSPRFVVVGAAASSVFGSKGNSTGPVVGEDGAGQIVFTGRLSDEEIVALYANADALFFPSLYEGFGIPPLEAMLLGCPVISSDIPPTREVCGDAAIYFDPLQPPDMVRAIRALSDNPERRKEMIGKGHSQAQSFSWRRSAQTLVSTVREL